MKKEYRKLTNEQKARGIIFSSSLSEDGSNEGTIHEVHKDDEERDVKIERLLDDSFFNASHFVCNIIRK